MYVVRGLLDFIQNFLLSVASLYRWLNSPFIERDLMKLPLFSLLLQKWGVDMNWMYGITPLQILSTSLVAFLSIFLVVKLIGAIMDALPIL